MPKQRRDKKEAKKRKGQRPQLHCDDKRAQSVMKFLWGGWGLEQLERHIARRFPRGRNKVLRRVAKRIGDMHCCSMGYTAEDITRQLRKLLPREPVLQQ